MTQEVGCEVKCVEDANPTQVDIQALQNNVISDIPLNVQVQYKGEEHMSKGGEDRLSKLLKEYEELLSNI